MIERAAKIGEEFVTALGNTEAAIREALRRAQHPEPRVREFWTKVAELLKQRRG